MENTKIEWATHTFNPWEGCAKVSPGCKNCYAEGQHKLHHAALGKGDNPGTCWGVGAPRLGKSEDNWKKPLRWNRAAQAAGVRARVFCASMADVFEPQSALSAAFAGETAEVPAGKNAEGNPKTRTVRFVNLQNERLRLMRLIKDTPHLDWLLLTKRPEFIRPILEGLLISISLANSGSDMLPIEQWPVAERELARWLSAWLRGTPPANVWLGTSVESQEQADRRIVALAGVPATVRFLSCEPLLEAVDLTRWANIFRIDWCIVGGESGPKARPMHPQWAESLRDQCQAAGVAYFFKQWGEWGPTEAIYAMYPGKAIIPARLGYKLHDFTPGLIKRSIDDVENEHIIAWKLGKHAAGRLLDGRTWDEVPTPQPAAQ
jgi:protein gp37